MNVLKKHRAWVIAGAALAGVFLLYQLWVWEVERVEVPPDHFLVRIDLWGKDLPEGEILAPDPEHKGVQRELLTEGRHFLNPLLHSYEVHKVTVVPPGKCVVLTRKAGAPLPEGRLAKGEFLAGAGERGVVREVLLPGKHRIHPHEYHAELVDAVEIKAHQVGVRTLKHPAESQAADAGASAYVVARGWRGVQRDFMPPGTYYLNPYVEAIIPVDISSHTVEFSDITFPSRDGFTVQPHVKVVYRVERDKAPELFVKLSDEGKLHQADATEAEKASNEILQKVVLPLIRGTVRVEGSKFDARDFISLPGGADAAAVNPRERLRAALMERFDGECKKLGVVIQSITVGQLEHSAELTELADQISARERARITREKNAELIDQYKQDQDRRAKEVLAEQKRALVDAGSKREVEKERAKQLKEVEQAKLEQELKSAKARLEAAQARAKAVLTEGKAEAAVIGAHNKAEVAGLRTAVAAFGGADAFADYHMAMRLAPALAEVFASDTGDVAKMYLGLMAPPAKRPAGTAVAKPSK